MATISKPHSSFSITPHKLSICVLVQVYAPPSQISIPFPFSSFSQHNRLGIFLLALTKACDGIFEPTLDELIAQLREIGGLLNHWLSDHLTRRLSSLASPDDLFNFFADLRGNHPFSSITLKQINLFDCVPLECDYEVEYSFGAIIAGVVIQMVISWFLAFSSDLRILGGSDSNVMDDDQIMLDPNSNIGIFVRRCLLAFNQMSFECICHLLTNIGTYCKESLSGYPPYELSHLEDSANDPNASLEFENMEMENYVYEKVGDDFEEGETGIRRNPFHGHAPNAFSELVKDTDITSSSRRENIDTNIEVSSSSFSSSDITSGLGSLSGSFLHTNWQVQGYLSQQADAIEKQGSSFPLNAFESILKRLQKLAPELHRVHYLRYLNSLHHDDYPCALENLHRYFDYRSPSSGTEGVEYVSPPSGCSSFGRYEIALLCLGMMHFHLGHPKQALEVLTEAVRVSQQKSHISLGPCGGEVEEAIGELRHKLELV
ncbi:hypothetical protein BUALT_Bualt03G0223100 [Buddleja alternifolia]|uniref:Anaphase-promoting complex subunit 5 n=1 Tax=Buddleja alternifolia TaxID=168488 RepID=A0AAV6XY22_9LAMI|nr:hypothetical protein BUALT_Bualt03G0223100 [Buddleja alternifolia]